METDRTQETLNRRRDPWILLLKYTVLFAIMVIGIYAIMLLLHKSFIQYGDGYKQGYFWTVDYKQRIEALLAGEGFSLWSWSMGTGMDLELDFYLDPFNLIAALFPVGYVELGYSFASVLKMYVSGLAFIAFAREVRMTSFQKLAGSLCYVFSGWFISVSLTQSSFLINAILFPLLALSVDRVYKGKSPVLFILVVAYYLVRNIYFAYMAAIVIILYILLRYFAYYDRWRPKEFFSKLGVFIGCGIIGVMLSAFETFTAVMALTGASTESSADMTEQIFEEAYYMGFGERLLGRGMTYDYLDIGLPILVFLLFPVALKTFSRRSTHVIMSILLFIMMLFPFFCSMFNGFGYPTLRWSYTLIFFAVWAGSEQLDRKVLSDVKSVIMMFIGWLIIAAWTVGMKLGGIINFGSTEKVFIPLQLLVGLVMILVLALGRKRVDFTVPARLAIYGLLIVGLSIGWSWGFYNHHGDFLRNNSINKQLEHSTQRVGNQIQDEGFYRIDQVDGITLHQQMKYPANENLWWKTRNIYVYNTRIPQTLLEFNRLVGNSYGYCKRVYMLSNGNRMGLDFLYGVKYFLGDDTKNGTTGSDAYAGYGFEPDQVIDGVNVFRSSHDAGLGFVYEQILPESEFMKLSRLEREQALLQAAVLPDEEAEELKQVKKARADTLDLDVKDIPYEVTETDGITFKDGKIIAEKSNAFFKIAVSGVRKSQMVVSFDNLMRDSKDGKQSESFQLSCKCGGVKKTAINEISNQAIAGIRDYDMNMGYYDAFDGTIRIKLSKKGTYTYDKLYVSAMSAENFDTHARACEANKLQISSFDDWHVKGTVYTEKDGILYLSMPVNENWEIYIDGQKAEKLDDVNIAFLGAAVPKGEHDVQLLYRNRPLIYGGAVSAAGFLLMLIVGIASLRRRKRKTHGDQEV